MLALRLKPFFDVLLVNTCQKTVEMLSDEKEI